MSCYLDESTKLSLDSSNCQEVADVKIRGYLPKTFANIKDGRIVFTGHNEGEYIYKYSKEGVSSESENEHFFLWLANKCKLKVSENILVCQDENYHLLSKRFDKDSNIIHCADLFSTKEQRRNISIESILKTTREFGLSDSQLLDMHNELLAQFLYSNTIGNYDLHAYNLAFLYKDGAMYLAPAYDIVCTQIFDESTRSAIQVNGLKSNVMAIDILNTFEEKSLLTGADILESAESICLGINEYLSEITHSYMNKDDIEFAKEYISKKNQILLENLSEFSAELAVADFSSSSDATIELV